MKGKDFRGLIDEIFQGVMNGGLVVLDGQKVVGPVFKHQDAGGFVLGMEGVEADHAPVQIEFFKKGSGHGDLPSLRSALRAACGRRSPFGRFVGLLGGHQCAAQIELTLRGDGGEHGIAAAVLGFLAVDVDEGGRCPGSRGVPGVASKLFDISKAIESQKAWEW